MASKRTDKRKAEQAAQAKRDGANFCGATTQAGGICQSRAGYGTDHPGTGRCKHHGGQTRDQRLGTARQENDKVANGMAVQLRVSPSQAASAALNLAAGQLAHATAKVAELREEEVAWSVTNHETGIPTLVKNVWLQVQQEALDRLAKFAKLAHDMGVADRDMALREAQTQIVAAVLDRVLGDLELTPAQRKQVAPAIRKHLVALPDMEEVAA